jgi:hypothetical protein
MADIDGDRLVVMSYMWGNYCFDSYEEGPSGIWTYRFDVDKGRWEFEEELIDDLWEWPSGWRSIGIDGDLVFAATFSYSPVQVYNGRAATVWRASDTGWDLVSRIQRPVSAYSATIAFPGMPLAASGNRCVLSNLSPERQDAILVTMDADGNGVLDIDQVLANPKIDADGTGIPDAAEYDCNENGIADALDIYMDPSLDNPSHSNGVIDACEPDLDGNGIPDWIDILEGTFVDFNENWIPDALEGDCNNNGIGDVIEIAMGLLDDFNGDWIPDECQCLADLSQNGVVDIADVLMLIATWGETCSLGDLNGDNTVEVQDLLYLIAAWGGCP